MQVSTKGEHEFREIPPARVNLLPIALVGTAVWLVAFVVVAVMDLGTLARDITLTGLGLGVLGSLVSTRFKI